MPVFAAMCLLSRATFADVKVELAETASVTKILEDLSRKSGVSLTITPDRGAEILIVDLKSVPLSDAMTQIAWATYGNWRKEGDGYSLVRDRNAEIAAERHYEQWQSQEAAKAIDRFQDRILQKHLSPEMSQFEQQMSGRVGDSMASSLDRVLAKALKLIRPETTIYTKQDGVAVYSDQPTAAQYAFKSDVRPILAEFNASSEQDARHVLVSCRYAFESTEATVALFDAKGERVAGETVHFGLYDAKSSPRPKEFADEVSNDEDVPLSETSKSYIHPYLQLSGWPSDQVLADMQDVVQKLQNPEKYEPLATFATDVWRAVAARQKRSLVANIDDVYMTPTWTYQPPKLGDAFRTAGGYNSELKPGWLLARPSLASPPWQHRLDRAALGKLCRAKATTAVEAFEAIAAFAGQGDVAPDPYATSQYLAWAGYYYLIDLRMWPEARLFGSLPNHLQQKLLSGGTVDVADVPPVGREVLQSLTQAYSSDDDLWHEPSVRFPNGAPQKGSIWANVERDATVYILTPSPNGLVFNQVGLSDAGDFLRDLTKKDPDAMSKIRVQFAPSPGIWIDAMLPPDAKVSVRPNMAIMNPPVFHDMVTWDAAPEWMKKLIMQGH